MIGVVSILSFVVLASPGVETNGILIYIFSLSIFWVRQYSVLIFLGHFSNDNASHFIIFAAFDHAQLNLPL